MGFWFVHDVMCASLLGVWSVGLFWLFVFAFGCFVGFVLVLMIVWFVRFTLLLL